MYLYQVDPCPWRSHEQPPACRLNIKNSTTTTTAVSGEGSPCSSSCFSPSLYFNFNTTPLLARAVVGILEFRAAVQSVSGHASYSDCTAIKTFCSYRTNSPDAISFRAILVTV